MPKKIVMKSLSCGKRFMGTVEELYLKIYNEVISKRPDSYIVDEGSETVGISLNLFNQLERIEASEQRRGEVFLFSNNGTVDLVCESIHVIVKDKAKMWEMGDAE